MIPKKTKLTAYFIQLIEMDEELKFDLMELIKNYLDARQAIYDHVGFKEDWVVYPIDDCTDKFWSEDGKIVRYANTGEILGTFKLL